MDFGCGQPIFANEPGVLGPIDRGYNWDRMQEDPWDELIPNTYWPGRILQGAVVKIHNFGVLVELAPGLTGLVHASEFDQSVVLGQIVSVMVLRTDREEKKIGLSIKRAAWKRFGGAGV